MDNYNFNSNVFNDFIASYKINGNKLILTLISGEKRRIAYTQENEEKVINKINWQNSLPSDEKKELFNSILQSNTKKTKFTIGLSVGVILFLLNSFGLLTSSYAFTYLLKPVLVALNGYLIYKTIKINKEFNAKKECYENILENKPHQVQTQIEPNNEIRRENTNTHTKNNQINQEPTPMPIQRPITSDDIAKMSRDELLQLLDSVDRSKPKTKSKTK